MTGITDTNASGTTLVSYGYTYDAAGRVSQETRTWASGGSTDTLTYGYTNNNQLTSVSHTNASFANESFSYDANGNRTGTGYTTTTGNEQTASPGYTYTYDADGNMITATQTSTGDVWTYTYDYRNRMTGAVEKNSSGTVLAQVAYTYDALDNRIGIDQNGVQTWTLFDTSAQVVGSKGARPATVAGAQPIMDFTASGSLATRYLNGPEGAIDAVLSRQSASGTVAWYLPDRLGTIRDLIGSVGAIIDHVDYSAFGAVLDESAPSQGDRIMGFGLMERDTTTGLNLAVNRVESPRTGRFSSMDPASFYAGDTELYRYVSNSPTMFVDPSGLDFWSGASNFANGVLWGAGGALLIGGVTLGAAAIGVPIAVISGGVLLVGGAGFVGLAMDAWDNWQCSDWDGLAYNAGSLLGGGLVGVPGGGRMPGAVKLTSIKGLLAREVNLRYQPFMKGGSFGAMMGSAGSHPGYSACLIGGGAGGASGKRRFPIELKEIIPPLPPINLPPMEHGGPIA